MCLIVILGIVYSISNTLKILPFKILKMLKIFSKITTKRALCFIYENSL